MYFTREIVEKNITSIDGSTLVDEIISRSEENGAVSVNVRRSSHNVRVSEIVGEAEEVEIRMISVYGWDDDFEAELFTGDLLYYLLTNERLANRQVLINGVQPRNSTGV